LPKLLEPPSGEEWSRFLSYGGAFIFFLTQSGKVYVYDNGYISWTPSTNELKIKQATQVFSGKKSIFDFHDSDDNPFASSIDHGFTQILEPPEGEKWENFVSGKAYYFGFTQSGKVYAGGDNEYGLLGLGDKSIEPVQPQLFNSPSGEQWKEIIVGGEHSFGITQGGEVYAWGFNNFGQLLGTEDRQDRLSPTLLNPPIGEKWISIAAGRKHSLGLTQNYNLYSWGSNSNGQLGDKRLVEHVGVLEEELTGFSRQLLNPPEGEKWKGVIAMADFSFGFTERGNTYGWGDNCHGQLGLGFYEGVQSILNPNNFDNFFPRLLKPPLGERWKFYNKWDDLRIIFIAYYKEHSSEFYKEKLPLEIFKFICSIV